MAEVDVLMTARRRGPGIALGIMGACVLLIGSSGCLFAPRQADSPATGGIVRYLEQIIPENVWDNLETSLEAAHAPGWEGNISSLEFRYIPDSAAESQFPGAFTEWNRERELGFINSLYNSGVTIVARMRNLGFVVPPSSGSESIWESVIYDVRVTSTIDGSVVRYSGKATITFRLEGNFWYIYEWIDQQGESDPDTGQLLSTMGVLRGNFASK